MNTLFTYLKNGWLDLTRQTGFFLTVLLTLGITLGALFCVISLNYLLISKPLPYPDQENLFVFEQVYMDQSNQEKKRNYSFPAAKHVYENSSTVDKATMIDYAQDIITSHSSQPLIYVNYTTPEYGELFSVPMARGRFLSSSEALGTQNPNIVISYEVWKKYYGLREDILDVKIKLSAEVQYNIIGVVAENFYEPQLKESGRNTDVWLPWEYNISLKYWGWSNNTDTLFFVGNTGDSGSSKAEQILSSSLNTQWQQEVVGSSDSYIGWRTAVKAAPLKDVILGSSSVIGLLLLGGVVGLVLIACANITNIYMSRIAEKQRSLAIRAAIGAKKSSLFKLMFRETLVMMSISALFGLILSYFGFYIIQSYFSSTLPRTDELGINFITIISALVVALSLAYFFARVGIKLINYDELKTLINSSGKGTGVQVSKRTRSFLIISQIAIASSLILICLSIFQNAYNQVSSDKGFSVENISNVYLNYTAFGKATPEAMKADAIELKEVIESLPEVKSVSRSHSPLQKFIDTNVLSVATGIKYPISIKRIDHKYIDLVKQRIIKGKNFTQSEVRDESKLLLINQALAEQLSTEKKIIGMQLKRRNTSYVVIGVVNNIDYPNEKVDTPRAYLIAPEAGFNYVIQYEDGKRLSREELVKVVKGSNRYIDIFLYDDLEEQLVSMQFSKLTGMYASLVISIIVILLAVIGLYGVINYNTVLRRFEIGTRMAIGAKNKNILGLILKDAMQSVIIGFVAGSIIIIGLAMFFKEAVLQYFSSQVIPLTVLSVTIILVITVLACLISVRKYVNKPISLILRNNQ